MLYFDNAATSWPKPEIVYQTHDRIFRQGGNAGRGVNSFSLQAGRVLLNTRNLLSKLFNINETSRIIFTQNVTESLNTGLQGLLSPGDHAIISPLEHNSVVRTLEYLKEKGITYTVFPCTPDGRIDLNLIDSCFRPNTKLLCCTHASNVLGSIFPLPDLGQLAKKHNCLFMVDAAQTAGILPINVLDWEIDFLAFTGHKGLLGPQGVGGYYVNPQVKLKPLIYGGTGTQSLELSQPEIWPEGMESGTRNIPGIAALGAGVEFILERGLDKIRQHEINLTQLLLEGLTHLPGINILGPLDPAQRIGLISCSFTEKNPDQVCFELDRKYGIITRSGLHCSPLAHKTAGTIEQGALRISLSYFHTEADIQTLLTALQEVLKVKE